MFVKQSTYQTAITLRNEAQELAAKTIVENERLRKDHEARATVLADKVRELERRDVIIADLKKRLAPFEKRVRGDGGRYVSEKVV